MTQPRAILLVQCPDRPGIVAAISSFLYRHGANILDFDQHTSVDNGGAYFTRLEFQTDRLDLPVEDLERAFALDVARPFGMEWRLTLSSQRKKVAILVSKHDHALLELLWNWDRGDLHADVSTVISNHPDLRESVESFGVPFVHVPNSRDTRAQAEARMLELLEGKADLVVLARYMQIVSPELVARWPNRIINIHHSFLPAFVGADPYRQAYDRGVKIVGATAHYVTAELDAGPIIDQDVGRVSHRDAVDDLKRLGRDLERRVLARAVRWHCEDRVIVNGNKTVVFS
ncbi:formyltetrahydrofolate deformylase [Anaeromyxobacter sp. K]|uniref:Formyltetrahydrofolate deformylase n=1 Tax=Anaeromyxobacter dehalogenans (strain ATCC BAA-258 / DSM 21875 / 2CP-1) TaxID=455488 RepID=B8J7A3_ANAD2|nr:MULTISPECIES: formyltetrahydrofolate deformylase [Anaeromyxobacter]ACG73094.1 formyltetrahydrofolate deformylase [Anaeromyxobacter sp. K]ACL65293.1 formyltetrahydrofolate deformylase [Anaeromyxobacter dehalogenans 2CP-1]